MNQAIAMAALNQTRINLLEEVVTFDIQEREGPAPS